MSKITFYTFITILAYLSDFDEAPTSVLFDIQVETFSLNMQGFRC